ncbi:hypothetical protein KFE98_14795 [bacterium SCSIO 12741]|nr:hypothetical protein KFE98_14795 [bacterium SCSIO 12741]
MSQELYNSIGQNLADEHETTAGQMFGKPCLKTGKKAFAAFFQEEMVFKLGQEEVNQLKEKYLGSVNWDPSGKKRAMKDWLQVPQEYSEDWSHLANQARLFVENS